MDNTTAAVRDVLVIVPAYKNPEQLQRCLDAVAAQTVAERIAIYVRDNSDDNILFTAAVNEGIRYGLSQPGIRYFLMLNQDCYLEPAAVELLVGFMDQFSAVGIAAPLQLDSQRPDWVVWAGSRRTFPSGTHLGGALKDYTEPFLVAWANGAAAMLRREMVVEIGLLDENMRFTCSDSDYSFTARARGWQVVCVPTARCVHECGEAKAPQSLELKRVIVTDNLYFAGKWFTGALFKSLEDDERYQCDLESLRAECVAISDDLKRHGDSFLKAQE